MTKVDQFESVFRSAFKEIFIYRKIDFKKILIVTDLSVGDAPLFANKIQQFAHTIHIENHVQWKTLSKEDFHDTVTLLSLVDAYQPDLIFTYRNLHSAAWRYPHSLGEFLDVLVNKTQAPVVVVPHPESEQVQQHAMKNTDSVMLITDHLTNDHDLINYAARFTQNKGKLILMHIECEDTFSRYITAISKIPSIDTQDAEVKLRHQLLKGPRDYISTVHEILEKEQLPITIVEIVGFGHHLEEYRKYIAQYQVDLLVMNTKDKQQMAMHGLAYPLAVELRQIPLLMI